MKNKSRSIEDFQNAAFRGDGRTRGQVRTYSWLKRLSRRARRHTKSAVIADQVD
jgi:hypothetical protein